MNKSYRSTALLIALAVTLAPLGYAQATGAVTATTNAAASAAAQAQAAAAASAAAARTAAAAQNAATATTAAATNAANSAQNAVTSASLNAGTAAGSAATTGVATSGVNTAAGVSNSVNGSSTLSAGTMPSASVNASGSAAVSTGTQAGSLSVSSLASQGASASLNSAAVVGQIRDTEMGAKDEVSGEVQTRLEASARAFRETQEHANALRGAAQARFQATVTVVRQREREVRSCLTAFRNASADKIDDTRAQLASSYQAYASAVAQAEVAGQISGGN